MRKYLIPLAVASFFFIYPLCKKDEEGYDQLLKSSEPQEMRALCQQQREGVTKSVRGEGGQYCSIESQESDLFFFTEKGEVEMIEELKGVACLLEESGTKRFVEAEVADFNYNTEIFTTQNVKLCTLDGEKQSNFSNGLSIESQNAYYDGEKVTLCGSVHVENEMGEIFANEGFVDCENNKKHLHAKKVTLLGDIRMINKKKGQYALADIVEYFPDQGLVILKGEQVLFYDKNRGVELSAKEVHAKRDENKKESVQGIGDVRFLLDGPEMEKLQKKFQW